MTQPNQKRDPRPSPLQNKVNPEGAIEAVSTRMATLMGNRGVLHNSKWQLTKTMVKNQYAWIYCIIEHGDREPRELMKPGCYTELFFLDEASALAAGHRPCNDHECLRSRHEEFKRIWYYANGDRYTGPTKYIGPIDLWLHGERTGPKPVILRREAALLPNGAFVADHNTFFVLWKGQFLEWSHQGYVAAPDIADATEFRVITPHSVLRCLDRGFIPGLHPSAQSFLSS